MADNDSMAEDAVATMREAMARALGGNCTFVDDDGFLLAALARRAIDAGLADDLNPSIVRNMKRRDELEGENDRLRSLNAELVEALEVIIGRSRFDSEEEWMDFIDAVDEGRRILSRARAKEDT